MPVPKPKREIEQVRFGPPLSRIGRPVRKIYDPLPGRQNPPEDPDDSGQDQPIPVESPTRPLPVSQRARRARQ